MQSLSTTKFCLIGLCAAFIASCTDLHPHKKIGSDIIKDSTSAKHPIWKVLEKEKEVTSIKDTIALLKQFFAPDTIVHKVALWKPDPEAKFNMNVSYDGYCHTRIDTVIKINDSDNNAEGYNYHVPGYLIVFATMHYYDYKNGESSECQLCGANYGCACVIGKTVQSFDKNIMTSGNDGTIADRISLRKMGYGYPVLDIVTGYKGSGFIEYENLFSLPDLAEVLSLRVYNSNDGIIDITEKNFSCVPNKEDREHDDLKVRTIHTYLNTKNKKVSDVSYQSYKWDDEKDGYVKAKYSTQ